MSDVDIGSVPQEDFTRAQADMDLALAVQTDLSVKARACAAAAFMVEFELSSDPDLVSPGIADDLAAQLIEFGVKADWPPAETFARQAAKLGNGAFFANDWRDDPRYRAPWEAFRAVAMALAPIKLGFDPEPESMARPVRRRDPDDDAHEQDAGMFDRVNIGGGGMPRPMSAMQLGRESETGREPVALETINGIGKATADRLRKHDIADVQILAAIDDATLGSLPPDLIRALQSRSLFGKPSPIDQARALVASPPAQ